MLALFTLVIGGIYDGWFSPTEAAAVGATGAFLLAAASGEMSRAMLRECVRETAALSGMIFFILVGAAHFNNFLETTGLLRQLVRLHDPADGAPSGAGRIRLGIDLILFGILVVTVAEVGLITPPVGMNLFVVQGTVRDLRIARSGAASSPLCSPTLS